MSASENPFGLAIKKNRQGSPQTEAPDSADSLDPPKPVEPARLESPQPAPRKRGRPATGKRSDAGWIGRTFYIKEETDLDVEATLLQLKRQGIKVDKSELVEMLLSAWVNWHQGENLEIQLGEISPIQKGK